LIGYRQKAINDPTVGPNISGKVLLQDLESIGFPAPFLKILFTHIPQIILGLLLDENIMLG
jgi:hypothetical protein